MQSPYHDLVSFGSPVDVADALDGDGPAATVDSFPVTGRRGNPAFTLVEMLVVMGVILTLMAVTIPVFKNLVGGRAVEQSINTVTGMLELARTTAITQRTRTYVIFENSTNSDNNSELLCAVVVSLDGTNGLDASSIPNLRPITKLIKVTNIKNVIYAQLPSAVQKVVTPQELTYNGSYIAGYYTNDNSHFPAVMIDGRSLKGATYVPFYDDGEIGTSGDNYNLLVQPIICLGLAKTVGTSVLPNATDGAVVVCYGGNSKLRVFRP